MSDEAVIVKEIGSLYLAGPPLVKVQLQLYLQQYLHIDSLIDIYIVNRFH